MNLDGTSLEQIASGVNNFQGLALDINYPPVAPGLVVTETVGYPLVFTLPAYDPNASTLRYHLDRAPAHGTLSGFPAEDADLSSSPAITYTPEAGFVGSDSLAYTVSDAHDQIANGMVSLQVIPEYPTILEAVIKSPTQGAVLGSLDSIALQVGAVSNYGVKSLALRVNGQTAATQTYPSANAKDFSWNTSWKPSASGAYRIDALAVDWHNHTQTTTYPITVFIDLASPSVSLDTTSLNLESATQGRDSLPLMGTYSDDAGVTKVEVYQGGWQLATLRDGTWSYNLPLNGYVMDGETTHVSLRVTDLYGRTTTRASLPVVVDYYAPDAPILHQMKAPDGSTLQAGNVYRGVLGTATFIYSNAFDKNGQEAQNATYFAGWTETAEATLADLRSFSSVTPVTITLHERQALYAHLAVRDPAGNITWWHSGAQAVTIDTPLTPDRYLTQLENGGQSALGEQAMDWLQSGGSLLGIDRQANRISVRAEQKLYTSWDEHQLALAWRGADWDLDGELFIYLDTASGGANVAYDPWGSGPQVNLPAAMQADYALRVLDGQSAQLYHYASGWTQIAANDGVSGLAYDYDAASLTTLLRIPFSLLEISDPAATPLQMVAFAVEPEAMRLWAALPEKNPLNSRRALPPNAQPEQITSLSLLRRYNWPSLRRG